MKSFVLTFVSFAFTLHFSLSKRFQHYRPIRWSSESDSEEVDHPRIWALLVAGSNGWYNYRHQSDVCHAYHTMRNHGIPEDQIVTMMYDDIAMNPENPYPGKIFNRPDGKDVYEGVRIDYKGQDVTPENFLAILQGNESGVIGGNGRVLQSDGNDHIFVYFTDHGGVGLISFPFSILTAKDLNDGLKKMFKRKQYKRMVFYLEACESGSMFNKILPKNINIYAITAANERESSWGCYCENDMGLPCLGDLFSVSWMEDSDPEDLTRETLEAQYEYVKQKTNRSHVMHYGDLSIADEYVADYQGWERRYVESALADPYLASSAWPARDVLLNMLKNELDEEDEPHRRRYLKRKIEKIERKRKYLEDFMIGLVERLVDDTSTQRQVLSSYPHAITQLQCHDEVVKAFHRSCFHFNRNPYALKYAYVLANLCEEGIETEIILQELLTSCLNIEIVGIH